MRTLFLKQAHDIFGPWDHVTFAREEPAAILAKFLYKTTFWDMTCALQGDWRIVPTLLDNYYRELIRERPHAQLAVDRFQSKAIALASLPIRDYDIVITFEPFLTPDFMARFPDTRFYYFRHEHGSPEFKADMQHPAGTGYTALLDHMCGMLPHPPAMDAFIIDLPYMRAPDVVRSCFPLKAGTGKPRIRIEPRTIIKTVKKDSHNLWIPACDDFVAALNAKYDATITVREHLHNRSYNTPVTAEGDAIAYYADLTSHDFFISTVAAGAGQALADAASANLICLGTEKLVYHRMLCAPTLLQDDFEVAIEKAIAMHTDDGQKAEARAHQDAQLDDLMLRRPHAALAFTPREQHIPPRTKAA